MSLAPVDRIVSSPYSYRSTASDNVSYVKKGRLFQNYSNWGSYKVRLMEESLEVEAPSVGIEAMREKQ
jgi:hypothetical protein